MIDLNRLNIRHEYLRPANESFIVIVPTGKLVAVLAEIDWTKLDTWKRDDIQCEITNDYALFAEFTIPAATGYDQGGIRFQEPLPNINTRFPYTLAVKSPHPYLNITIIGEWTS